MEAIRQITQLENDILTLKLPASFKAKQVEVIVMLVEETVMAGEDRATETRRRPSPKLKGTRIIGDIMSPAVPEADWDVLKTSPFLFRVGTNSMCPLDYLTVTVFDGVEQAL